MDRIVLPEGVAFIADDAFDHSDVVLVVTYGTYAADWAFLHDVPFNDR